MASSVGRLGVTLFLVACSGAPSNAETARAPVEPASAPDGGNAAPRDGEATTDGGPSDGKVEFLQADPDADQIPNAEDTCPYDPGPRSKRREINGCPSHLDPGPVPVVGPLIFPKKSATIPPEMPPALDVAVRYLLDNPRERVLVVGFSEWGEPRKLAGARAQAVIDYFVSKELPRERFDLEARPAKEPPPAERTPREREHDRRAFLRLLVEEGSSGP